VVLPEKEKPAGAGFLSVICGQQISNLTCVFNIVIDFKTK
jgi:hypothetical protein